MLRPVLERERRTVAAYLSAGAHRLQSLLPRVEHDADIEALHQFRVELRRIRTGLMALRGALPLADAADLIAECRWLAGRGGGRNDERRGAIGDRGGRGGRNGAVFAEGRLQARDP